MIGIDFGTTTTFLAESAPGLRPTVVPVGESTDWMPSLVALRDGRLVAGEDAQRTGGETEFRSVKRAITRRATTLPTRLGEVQVDEVISVLLGELAGRAKYQGLTLGNPGEFRLGCPAMWDARQRQRLLRLATDAGFAVGPSSLVDEPVAAGLTWVNDEVRRGNYLDQERVLVFDMGGGTLDVSILDAEAGPGIRTAVHVLASQGVDEAGDSVDAVFAEDILDALLRAGAYRSEDRDGVMNGYAQRSARAAKETLTDMLDVAVGVDDRRVAPVTVTYAREQLDEILEPQLQRAWELMTSVLRSAELTNDESTTSKLRATDPSVLAARVHHVVLAGGMSHVSAIYEFMARKFPSARLHRVEPDQAVALGLAEIEGYDSINLNRPPFTFVLEWPHGRQVLYEAYTPVYESWEVSYVERPRYEWREGAIGPAGVRTGALPSEGSGLLTARGLDGTLVPFRYQGVEIPGLRVAFGHGAERLALGPSGRLTIEDGRGNQQNLRLDGWPVLTSGSKMAIDIRDASLPIISSQTPEWVQRGLPWWDNE